MPKIYLREDGAKLFHCPGCGCAHFFDERWEWNGSTIQPTFSPSLSIQEGVGRFGCHSFVRDGKITFLSDCTHKMAGQVVVIPEWGEM